MKWDTRVPIYERADENLLPLEEHKGESRWQTCMCKTCQRKRKTYDSLPGRQIDWERYKKNSDWHYNAIFYVGE
jgi:hypothetical protein